MNALDVIALGGNAILPAGGAGTIFEQFAITRGTMSTIAGMVAAGRRVVLTHGNGPIVGNIVLRNEAMRNTIPPMPLGICVADSQGGIGYMLQQVLRNALYAAGCPREVVSLVTQVEVSSTDPSLANPSKPIGPYYTEAQANALVAAQGWNVVEDSKRGWRRVVPSPRPVSIVEIPVIRQLVASDCVVITVGGGGVPVTVESGDRLEGVEAVVDKDYATAVLARDLNAERMIIVTGVDAVYRDYGTPEQTRIKVISVADARELARSLPAGSMGPKVAAAADFVGGCGGVALITRPEDLQDALAGRAGTRVVP